MDTREITTALPRLLIRLYQIARRGSARRCRFYPSCSEYALQAFESKGFWKGLGFGLLRILKCHPWHPGGFDPVHCMTSSPAFIGGAAMHNISIDPPPALVGDDGN